MTDNRAQRDVDRRVMDRSTQHSKESNWLSCKQKRCCYAAFVVPSGRDVWRIARALDTPPWSFAVFFTAPQPRPDAFTLDRSGQGFCLALAKQPGAKKTPPPCIFLMRTRNGHHRCGLGDLRPQVCKTFPSEMASSVLYLRDDSGCTCRTWTLADVDIAEEKARIEVRAVEFEEYCSVVARWNVEVRAAPPTSTFTFFDYCNFLLAVYDELAAASEVAAVFGDST